MRRQVRLRGGIVVAALFVAVQRRRERLLGPAFARASLWLLLPALLALWLALPAARA